MDPLTSRITRILVDKGTFYALIPLFLTLPLSIIINYVSLFVNCVEVVRCVPTNWCNKRQPPQSHYEMPPRDYVLGGNPRRAALLLTALRPCVWSRVSAPPQMFASPLCFGVPIVAAASYLGSPVGCCLLAGDNVVWDQTCRQCFMCESIERC